MDESGWRSETLIALHLSSRPYAHIHTHIRTYIYICIVHFNGAVNGSLVVNRRERMHSRKDPISSRNVEFGALEKQLVPPPSSSSSRPFVRHRRLFESNRARISRSVRESVRSRIEIGSFWFSMLSVKSVCISRSERAKDTFTLVLLWRNRNSVVMPINQSLIGLSRYLPFNLRSWIIFNSFFFFFQLYTTIESVSAHALVRIHFAEIGAKLKLLSYGSIYLCNAGEPRALQSIPVLFRRVEAESQIGIASRFSTLGFSLARKAA